MAVGELRSYPTPLRLLRRGFPPRCYSPFFSPSVPDLDHMAANCSNMVSASKRSRDPELRQVGVLSFFSPLSPKFWFFWMFSYLASLE